MPYRFFFSYARANRDIYLDQFYQDLCREVRLQRYHAENQVGFFDGEEIQSGAPWKKELSGALATSRSFLALCSPDYINSEYCGKEFSVFLERYENYRSSKKPQTTPRLIQPVLWGAPSGSLRDVISQFQYTDDDYPAVYADEGLRYMMRLSEHAGDYEKFVTRLAQKLVDYSEGHRLDDAASLSLLDDVDSVFHDETDRHKESEGDNAWFVFVAAKPDEFGGVRMAVDRYRKRGGKDWRPYDPESRDTVGILAQTTVSKYGLYFGELQLNAELVKRIRAAEARGEIVVVLVDPWTLRLQGYENLMRKLDKENFENCSVIVTWNKMDPETRQNLELLQDSLNQTFKFKTKFRKTIYYWDSIASATQLRARLLKTLGEYINARMKNMSASRAIKDPKAQQSASDNGISYETAPLVGPPGAGSL